MRADLAGDVSRMGADSDVVHSGIFRDGLAAGKAFLVACRASAILTQPACAIVEQWQAFGRAGQIAVAARIKARRQVAELSRCFILE
jgi:hypothetical protein